MPVVFVPERIASPAMDLLRGHCDVVAPWLADERTEEDAWMRADAVIVRRRRVGGSELERAPSLKVIAKHGVGLDNIDLDAARSRGVVVVSTPAANSNAVAEFTVALMLGLARRLVTAVQLGTQWGAGEEPRIDGIELMGKTLGLVGLGRVGSRVGEIAGYGLRMRVVGYDPALPVGVARDPAEVAGCLEDVLCQADVLSLHVPLTAETMGLVNAERLGMLKRGCCIINTSRGGVIDEGALLAALDAGRVRGAALDVFETEPLPAEHPLRRDPNVLLTPHVASATREALEKMAMEAVEGVLDVLAGRLPKYPVTPEVRT